jgi:hypothetical protein
MGIEDAPASVAVAGMPVAKTVRPDRRTKHSYRRARIKVPQRFL